MRVRKSNRDWFQNCAMIPRTVNGSSMARFSSVVEKLDRSSSRSEINAVALSSPASAVIASAWSVHRALKLSQIWSRVP